MSCWPTTTEDSELKAQSQDEAQVESVQVDSPEKTHLRDWEILTPEAKTKQNIKEMPSKVKDIPTQVKERVMMIQPVLQGASGPLLEKLQVVLKRTAAMQGMLSEKYRAADVLEVALSTAMLFTGGRFPVSVACAQAFHIACWQSVKAAWKDLREAYFACSSQRDVELMSLADVKHIVYSMH